METHLDLLALDAIRAGEPAPAHVSACARCRAALEELKGYERQLKADAPRIEVPAEIRRSILAGARRRRPLWIPLAAAAAFLIVLLSIFIAPRTTADVDGNGRVDIVDAYTLALKLKAGKPVGRAWDLNRDGRVDRLDAEAIGRLSVAVGGGGR